MTAATKKPKRIGGWLILPAIGLLVYPFLITTILINDFLPIFQDGYWEILTTPSSNSYYYMWSAILVFEICVNLFFLIFALALNFLFFTKSYRLPALYIAFLLLRILFVVLDSFLINLIPALAALSNSGLPSEFVSSVIPAFIWVPYFLYSKRVKDTFVKAGAKASQQESTDFTYGNSLL